MPAVECGCTWRRNRGERGCCVGCAFFVLVALGDASPWYFFLVESFSCDVSDVVSFGWHCFAAFCLSRLVLGVGEQRCRGGVGRVLSHEFRVGQGRFNQSVHICKQLSGSMKEEIDMGLWTCLRCALVMIVRPFSS